MYMLKLNFTITLAIAIVISITCTGKSFLFEFTISPRSTTLKSQVFLEFISKTPLCIGTPPQCKTVQIDPGTYLSFLLGTEAKRQSLPETTFNASLSTSYTQPFKTGYIFAAQKIISGTPSCDIVNYGSITLNNTNFFLADDWMSEHRYSVIGLKIDFKANTFHSFILRLFEDNIIQSKEFSIVLIDENNGRVTIGESSEKEMKSYKKLFSIPIISTRGTIFHFSIGKAMYYNKKDNPLEKDFELLFDESFGLIQMPISHKKYIEENYLNGLVCEEVKYSPERKNFASIEFHYFLCLRSGVVNKHFDNQFTFAFEEGSFALNNEDAFIDYDTERLMFTIVFKEGFGAPRYIIGHPILKNFRVNHNFKDYTVTLFSKPTVFTNNNDNETPHDKSLITSLLYVIIIIVIALMAIGLCLVSIIFIRRKHKLKHDYFLNNHNPHNDIY